MAKAKLEILQLLPSTKVDMPHRLLRILYSPLRRKETKLKAVILSPQFPLTTSIMRF